MLTHVLFLILLLGRETISAKDDKPSSAGSTVVEEPSCAVNGNVSDSEYGNSTSELPTLLSTDEMNSRNESRRVACTAPIVPQNQLLILNASGVSEALSAGRNECCLLIFYSPHCMFSARSAPYLNGIARYYPNMSVIALQINESSTLSMKYGIIALPTVLLLHNHRAIAKLNHTNISLNALGLFIEKHTGFVVVQNMTLDEMDYRGPLPSQGVERTNWILFSAWTFTLMSLIWFLLRSSYALKAYNWFANTWKEAREAEQAARVHQD